MRSRCRRIRADLIYDKSKLNAGRVRVVWLSPNAWTGAGGFRYGHVRFTFDFAKLVKAMKYYWVESMDYKPVACRILISNDEHDDLTPYGPTDGDGPWWEDQDGEHYRNGEYCLEFMFEGNLPLRKVEAIDFVKHYPMRCSIDPDTCVYRGVNEWRAAAELVGRLVSHGTSLDLPGFTTSGSGDILIPSASLSGALTFLLGRSRRAWKAAGVLKADASAAAAVARALLGAVARASTEDAEHLASLFATKDDAERAAMNVLADGLGLADPDHLTEV